MIRFLLARALGNEDILTSFSHAKPEIEQRIHQKSVAIVGNARDLARGNSGPRIESADVVIRINGAPMASVQSHGQRTDWLAISVPVDRARLAQLDPDVILWMTRKRKRLPYHIARHPGFYLNQMADWQALNARLITPPTTGLMVIDLIARSQASKVTLFGFDFFASKSSSGRREASQVPHDFDAEKGYVDDLLKSDPRFQLVPPTQ